MSLILSAVLFCSCDVDHFAGQRPVEKPNSHWVCEEYNISFSVGEEGELIDATMEIMGETIPFEFTWFAFDNTVNIDFEVNDKAVYLQGKGVSESWGKVFLIRISHTKGYYPTEEVTLEFQRVDE